MYKFVTCICLLFCASFMLNAQQTDEIILDSETSIHSDLDERSRPLPNANHLTPATLRNHPHLAGKQLDYSTSLSGRNKGAVVVSSGDIDLVTTGFKKNKLHGAWLSRYDNGLKLDSGRFVNNIPDGEWHSYYKNGHIQTIRTYSAEKWFLIRSDISRANPRTYHFLLSKALGFSQQKFLSLTSVSNAFSNLPKGLQYHPPYQYGLLHGLYVNYYPSGAAKDSGYYKNGLREGMWTEYHSNGTISAQGGYLRGLKNGGWKLMNRLGKLEVLAEYSNGKLVHKKHYSHY